MIRPAHFPASFTVDVEQDCPPYLETFRGMTEGLPALLDELQALSLRGTFFVTGAMARRFPAVIARLVAEGHELGCHGDTHQDFTRLDRATAEREIATATDTLRRFGRVTSFRAPYLRFPGAYLPLLVHHGLSIDSSIARYKLGRNHRGGDTVVGLTRVPASITSSVLRLPLGVASRWLAALRRPLVLFVHPWEAVDFRQSSLRWDCRAATGPIALRRWRELLDALRESGAEFQPLRELAAQN